MLLNQTSLSAAAQYLGTATAAYFVYRLVQHATFYLLPSASLSRYQRQAKSWALITGASAGIGLSTAQELAVRGFNVVLLGHLRDELEQAAELIRSHSVAEVRIIVMNAITATPDEIQAAFQSIHGLPLTILVNNVGGFPISQPAIRYIHEYSGPELDQSLNLNARFMAQVSRILLPRLAANGPSLMLNLSSAARMGIPGVGPYSGCKGFVCSLTTAMAREASAAGLPIDILAIVPGDVRTQANSIALTPGSPSAEQFAKAMLDRAPRAAARGWYEFMPWWSHALAINALEILPSPIALRLLLSEFEKKSLAVAKAQKTK
jgi:17beta-estradiol 17-dehydrogenase / very-long-chain 3-oxoacyl-CoA reductase